jgi:hypothetical protein
MPIAAVAPIIGAGIGLYGASQQASAAKSAAKDQTAGQMAAIAEQKRQYDQSRADEMPYMQAGQSNLAQMGKLDSGDFSSFFASPDYNFTLQQGINASDAGAAARGGLYSGGHSADLMNYGQGLASQQYNSFYNKLAGIANLGQDATARTGALGAGAANQISDAYGNIGNANAMGAIGSANAWSNGLGGLASMLSNSSYGGGGDLNLLSGVNWGG